MTDRSSVSTGHGGTLGQDLKVDPTVKEREDPDGEMWEEVEVGKGLAQYNSVEIDRIKGMKRSVRILIRARGF